MSKILTSFKNMMGFEDEDYYDDYEDEMVEEQYEEAPKENYALLSRRRESKEDNKVVNLHNSQAKVKILKPETFDEAPQISDSLKENKIVVVNTSSLEPKTAQRLLDFIAGATYALGGELQEVENGVYVLTPANVDVSTDMKGESSPKSFLNWK